MWLKRAERDAPHLHMSETLQCQPLGLQLWDTHKDCREGCWKYRAGLLGLGQEWGKAETTREQFSEEILIGGQGMRNCFTSGYESEVRRTRQV